MKKTYKTPQLEAYSVVETELICASTNFGSGSTDNMHAKEGSFDIEGIITPTLEGITTTDATVNFDE